MRLSAPWWSMLPNKELTALLCPRQKKFYCRNNNDDKKNKNKNNWGMLIWWIHSVWNFQKYIFFIFIYIFFTIKPLPRFFPSSSLEKQITVGLLGQTRVAMKGSLKNPVEMQTLQYPSLDIWKCFAPFRLECVSFALFLSVSFSLILSHSPPNNKPSRFEIPPRRRPCNVRMSDFGSSELVGETGGPERAAPDVSIRLESVHVFIHMVEWTSKFAYRQK